MENLYNAAYILCPALELTHHSGPAICWTSLPSTHLSYCPQNICPLAMLKFMATCPKKVKICPALSNLNSRYACAKSLCNYGSTI